MSKKDQFNIEIYRGYRITQTVYATCPQHAEEIGEELQQEIDGRLTLSQWGPSLENRHPNTRVKIATYGEPSVDVDFNEEE